MRDEVVLAVGSLFLVSQVTVLSKRGSTLLEVELLKDVLISCFSFS